MTAVHGHSARGCGASANGCGRPERAGRQARPFSSGCRVLEASARFMPWSVAVTGELLDRLLDERLGLGRVGPALGLDPLAGLEVLVVLEEVLDLLARELGDVVHVLDVVPARIARGHRDDLGVA